MIPKFPVREFWRDFWRATVHVLNWAAALFMIWMAATLVFTAFLALIASLCTGEHCADDFHFFQVFKMATVMVPVMVFVMIACEVNDQTKHVSSTDKPAGPVIDVTPEKKVTDVTVTDVTVLTVNRQ